MSINWTLLALGPLCGFMIHTSIKSFKFLRGSTAYSELEFPRIWFLFFQLTYWGAFAFLAYIGLWGKSLDISEGLIMGLVLIASTWTTILSVFISWIISNWSIFKLILVILLVSIYIGFLGVMLMSPFLNP